MYKIPFSLYAFTCIIFLDSDVKIKQTIPEDNSPVCPGQVLQYTCLSNESSVGWIVDSEGDDHVIFQTSDPVNTSMDILSFEAVLTQVNESFLATTLTNPMITLDIDDVLIQCIGGGSAPSLYIAVAGLCTSV